MRIRLFTIPNMITLANLLCGVVAIVEVLVNKSYTLAFWLVVLAAVFDFFDGFVARLLSCQSPLGMQLDSLSDLISFGLAPTFILFSLAQDSYSMMGCQCVEAYLPYLTFLVVAFSALRLAKFNIDPSQSCNFVGLPTPASALVAISLGMLHESVGLNLSVESIACVALVLSVLMVSPLEMFSLKFKGVSWASNGLRYIFLAVAVAEIVVFGLYSFIAIITTYVLISISVALYSRRGSNNCSEQK